MDGISAFHAVPLEMELFQTSIAMMNVPCGLVLFVELGYRTTGIMTNGWKGRFIIISHRIQLLRQMDRPSGDNKQTPNTIPSLKFLHLHFKI